MRSLHSLHHTAPQARWSPPCSEDSQRGQHFTQGYPETRDLNPVWPLPSQDVLRACGQGPGTSDFISPLRGTAGFGLVTRHPHSLSPNTKGSPGTAMSGHPGYSGGCAAGLPGSPGRTPAGPGGWAPRAATPSDTPPGNSQHLVCGDHPCPWGASSEPEQG